MSVEARAERCTVVTNAVFGEADGAAVLAERAPPLTGGGEGEAVSLGGAENGETVRAFSAE
jgi:hypothetical protein